MKEEKKFKYLKKLINSNDDIKQLVESQFYYNKKAINFVESLNKNYFINGFYNLTTLDILLMADENDNIKEVKKQLFEEYEENYAKAIYNAFIEALGSEA